LKANGRFVFTDGGSLIGQTGWERASLIYRGENVENYRGYSFHGMNQSRDDWAPLAALTRALDRSQTPDAMFADAVDGIVDLDRFFRTLSTRILIGDGVGFAVNNGHNGWAYHDSVSGTWSLVPFDVEAGFSGSFGLDASLDPRVSRWLTHPHSRRVYLRVLAAFIDGYWSPAADPWLTAVSRATGYGVAGIQNHIRANAARARTFVAASEAVPLRILTNGGADIETDLAAITLEGEAPPRAATLLVSFDDGVLEDLRPTWTSPVRFTTRVELGSASTRWSIVGVDVDGVDPTADGIGCAVVPDCGG